jgi:lysophospholipase L1-like esterase
MSILFFLIATVLVVPHPEDPQLGDNETIVFFGDSITEQGDEPGGYVDWVRKTLRREHPERKVKIVGAGVGGNKVPDLLARLDRDVLSRNPTTVVVFIGVNDVWHSTTNAGTPKDVYAQGLERLVDEIRATKARVILCTPSVIGEKTDGTNPLDEMLDEYVELSRSIASTKNVPLLDLRKAFLEELKIRNPENRESGVLTRDGVHLNEAGNRFVGDRMLAAIGIGDSTAGIGGEKIRHIVLFKFKDGLKQAKIDEVVTAFANLPNEIDEITDFELGTNISPENLDQGFTHCFVVTFQSVEDRDTYLPHPAHQRFVKLLDGRIDKVLVFDYQF